MQTCWKSYSFSQSLENMDPKNISGCVGKNDFSQMSIALF